MALEDRSTGYQDLVSNNNALLAVLEAQGPLADLLAVRAFARRCKSPSKSRSGTPATISCSTRRSICSTTPVYDPKMVVVPVILSMQEILNNEGENAADGCVRQLHRRRRACARRHDGRRALRRRHRQRRQAAHWPRDCGARSSPTPASTAASIAPPPRSGRPRPTTRRPMAAGTRHAGRRATTIRPMLNYVMTKQSRGQRLRRSADHVAGTLRGLRRRDGRDPAPDQRDLARQARLLVRWSISAAASAPRSCSTAASAATCRRTRRSASNTDSLPAALSPEQKLRQAVRRRRPDADRQGRRSRSSSAGWANSP